MTVPIKVGILGASGYGGAGLLRRSLHHPEIEVVAVASRQYEGQSVEACWPQFTGLFDALTFSSVEETIAASDLVFCATPRRNRALGQTGSRCRQVRD